MNVDDFLLLKELPAFVSPQKNEKIIRVPTLEEVKVVMGLNRNSVGGLNVMTYTSYQDVWGILGRKFTEW